MPDPRPARTRLWKPRFTIGGVMISIAAIAIALTALRPIARSASSVYPLLSEFLVRFATVETGVVLSCLVIGAYVTIKLMSMDETK
ncbi:MAG: hypothetical protein JWN86_2143 [Planctomycetota bacterium]|nr:hypothetical protein [Planctomycetota bacterium]